MTGAHTPGKTMVCITGQKNCERLIREGANYAAGAELRVVHVVKPGGAVLGADNDAEALEYLFQISRTYGAQMDMLRSDDVVGTLTRFAQEMQIEHVVMGMANTQRSHTDVAAALASRLPGIHVHILP